MTERFTMCHEQNDINGWTMSIVDWQTNQPFDYTTYEVHSESITDTKDEMEDLCLLLNELHEENQSSKDFIEQLQEELVLFKNAGADMGIDLNNQITALKKENEQLKQQIKELKR